MAWMAKPVSFAEFSSAPGMQRAYVSSTNRRGRNSAPFDGLDHLGNRSSVQKIDGLFDDVKVPRWDGMTVALHQ